jgi:hypothetical protein
MKFYILECYSKSKFPILGWLIQLFQGFINFHHYALLVKANDGKLYTYDASGRTLHRESYSNFSLKYHFVAIYEIPYVIDQKSFFRWIFPLEGTVYGNSQILGLFLMFLNIYKKNPYPNGLHKLICNEFILTVLDTFGILSVPNIEDYDLVRTHKLLNLHFKRVTSSDIIVGE